MKKSVQETEVERGFSLWVGAVERSWGQVWAGVAKENVPTRKGGEQ